MIRCAAERLDHRIRGTIQCDNGHFEKLSRQATYASKIQSPNRMVAKVGRNKPNSDLLTLRSATTEFLGALDTAIDLAKVRHNVAIVLPLVCQVEAGIGQCVGRIDMNSVSDQSFNALGVSRSPVIELIGAVINNRKDFGSQDKVHRMRSGLLRCFKMV